jgi:putative addiction module component (TIGR02574 family)
VSVNEFSLWPLEGLDYSDTMSIDQIAAEALRLPPKERALLAESLWESLSSPHESSAEMDDRAALALARERDQQIEAGGVSPVLHDEMMTRLRR